VAELEARVAELEAEVTDLGAARARLLKLEESIRKHLGEFCGRPDEVTTVGQILTTVKEKLRRLQKSRAHQAGAAIAARDDYCWQQGRRLDAPNAGFERVACSSAASRCLDT